MIWIPDFLDDIESDWSAIHRISDIRRLSGPRFFAWTMRLFAYPGALQARATVEQAEQQEQPEPQPEPDVPLAARPAYAGDGYRYPPVFEDLTKRG